MLADRRRRRRVAVGRADQPGGDRRQDAVLEHRRAAGVVDRLDARHHRDSAIAALAAWRRCPRLAVAIVILAVARPLSEFVLKELIGRERPIGDRMVRGRGPAFPSGHPYAVAMAWGLIPMVVALYSRRPWLPRVVAVFAWSTAVAVAASRVWLGVHWTSDAAAGLLVGLLAVCLAERAVAGNGCGCPSTHAIEREFGLRE